jgi:hypothetical protein
MKQSMAVNEKAIRFKQIAENLASIKALRYEKGSRTSVKPTHFQKLR